MSEYDNTNSGTLFLNDKGDNDKRPDYTGKIDVNGIEYKLSAWIKSPKSGGRKFLSLRVSESNNSQPATKNRHSVDPLDAPDEIPF